MGEKKINIEGRLLSSIPPPKHGCASTESFPVLKEWSCPFFSPCWSAVPELPNHPGYLPVTGLMGRDLSTSSNPIPSAKSAYIPWHRHGCWSPEQLGLAWESLGVGNMRRRQWCLMGEAWWERVEICRVFSAAPVVSDRKVLWQNNSRPCVWELKDAKDKFKVNSNYFNLIFILFSFFSHGLIS